MIYTIHAAEYRKYYHRNKVASRVYIRTSCVTNWPITVPAKCMLGVVVSLGNHQH